jgi:hypothetical protein
MDRDRDTLALYNPRRARADGGATPQRETEMTRRFACSLAALAVGAALVGCGGSGDTDKFKRAYKADRQTLRQIGNDIGSAISNAPTGSASALATKFRSLASRTKTLLGSLRKLKPPGKVKTDFTALTSALARGQRDLSAIASAATANDANGAGNATRALIADSTAITRSANAVVSKLNIK